MHRVQGLLAGVQLKPAVAVGVDVVVRDATLRGDLDHVDFAIETILFDQALLFFPDCYRGLDLLTLDFPVDPITPADPPSELLEAFKKKPLEVYKGKTDYLLIYESQKDIEGCDPDMTLLKKSKARGIIVSAPGKKVHFVSRFFAPGSGVDEDPVTGSAHTTLTPYWSEKLGKNRMKARQLSKRGGKLICELKGDRVLISGRAVTYLKGEIEV